MIGKLFANWRFRTARPSLAQGQTIEVFLTAFDPATGTGQARIGDSVLEVRGAAADQVDELVCLEVESFDEAGATGAARLLD